MWANSTDCRCISLSSSIPAPLAILFARTSFFLSNKYFTRFLPVLYKVCFFNSCFFKSSVSKRIEGFSGNRIQWTSEVGWLTIRNRCLWRYLERSSAKGRGEGTSRIKLITLRRSWSVQTQSLSNETGMVLIFRDPRSLRTLYLSQYAIQCVMH